MQHHCAVVWLRYPYRRLAIEQFNRVSHGLIRNKNEIKVDNITTAKRSTVEPYAHFIGYVYHDVDSWYKQQCSNIYVSRSCRINSDVGVTVLLIKFLPSLPVTAQRGSAPTATYPPERATSGIATCSVVGDTYRPVAKLSLALGWWTLPCLACLWARIRARPAKQSAGWRNTVTNV